MLKVIQISDTHLRHGDDVAEVGWRAAAEYVAAARPDLVIHTGDIVRDDPAVAADHTHARRLLDALGVAWLAVPGNHDIGDGPPGAVTLTATLIERFEAIYDAAHWTRDVGSWRLIGVNAMLFGTGLDAEEVEWRFLVDAIETAEGRDIALFMHKPPFILDPGEMQSGSMALPPSTRRRFWRTIGSPPVRLIACGHRHEHRVLQHHGLTVVWAPATAALPETTPPLTGLDGRTGLVEFGFVGRTVLHRLVPLSGGPVAP